MLDLQDFIKERGGDPDKIRESQRRRHAPVEIVDERYRPVETTCANNRIFRTKTDHRKTQYAATQFGSEINAVQKEIGMKKKNKENADDLLKKKEDLQKQKKDKEDEAAAKLVTLNAKAKSIGNYVHDSVPISDNEDNNVTEREWKPEAGLGAKTEQTLSHHQVVTRLAGYDSERAIKLVGHRGYCLTGYGLFLNQALINYGLEFLFNKGYTPNQPPFFMNRNQMAKTAQLEQFDEELYKVTGDGEEKYLIATSEQPLSALHSEEWLQASQLPIKYAGYSTCFRKEAGKHGKEAWGLFRVHQFEKIEQFVFCKAEESWKHFDEMIAASEEFYKSLGLPYRVVSIVSGALNNAAAKKYDLEAWFPFQQEYKELVSCSNCTDYQTRELEVRYGVKKAKEVRLTQPPPVSNQNARANLFLQGPRCWTQGLRPRPQRRKFHRLWAFLLLQISSNEETDKTLLSLQTLCATERTLCCIMENYQTPDGLKVPEVLRKYIPGQPEFLPYVAELPKEITVVAGQKKK
ncbi:putative seryl-tRNA synthetase [Colletotrichum sublineola]|uniref:serine--tRNA ligase n=1 Tax=Colletotrichum sublineola TaxID=1173701 RepID=A0A066X1M5_COLSU|nr:putative seryl-tRNA synthetase [Colletotrichum sublineola]